MESSAGRRRPHRRRGSVTSGGDADDSNSNNFYSNTAARTAHSSNNSSSISNSKKPIQRSYEAPVSKSKHSNFGAMVAKHAKQQQTVTKPVKLYKTTLDAIKKQTQIPAGFVIGPTVPLEKKWKLGNKIGNNGSFGFCVSAVDIKTGKKRAAVKVISKADFQDHDYVSIRNEITVMRTATDHVNLIKLFDVFETKQSIFIVMECAYGGELFDEMATVGTYTEERAREILKQCTQGIKYLHDLNIAHCDIKPDNFMFSTKTGSTSLQDTCVKVIDFGMSKFTAENTTSLSEVTGTAYYIAPEVLKGKYTKHCDMWSLGVCMFVMLFGFTPFSAEDLNGPEIARQLSAGFFPEVRPGKGPWFPEHIRISEGARDLITQCLTTNPAHRINASEFLKHPFITGETAKRKPKTSSVIKDMVNLRKISESKREILKLCYRDILTEHELAELKTRFQMLDVKDKGRVTEDEMLDVMRQKMVSSRGRKEIGRYLEKKTNNGRSPSIDLRYSEYACAAAYKKVMAKQERTREVFLRVDADGDGRITRQDLTRSGVSNELSVIMLSEMSQGNLSLARSGVDFAHFTSYWYTRPSGQSNSNNISSSASSSSNTVSSSSSSKTLRPRSGKKKSSSLKKIPGIGIKLGENKVQDLLFVERIAENSPAAKALLKINDIIRKVNGVHVSTTAQFVAASKKARTLELEIKRGMQLKVLVVLR